ncbi:hypothetical protein H696_06278 [Fonticula alba]|uniref:TNFR-Cys domain-containing protein n=1 Tax=Fonticula alba TaxID=691883 RepID=A0A058YZK1_FONAL|nr:hypothetical protein H696_06278 [Fonticula alba]KCV67301.1 hypothetical protein H696_06278 [Fonticula alba]|eukprot:XP_009498293.1 hypothetical protein H696_06278 [Fonticula alba]
MSCSMVSRPKRVAPILLGLLAMLLLGVQASRLAPDGPASSQQSPVPLAAGRRAPTATHLPHVAPPSHPAGTWAAAWLALGADAYVGLSGAGATRLVAGPDGGLALAARRPGDDAAPGGLLLFDASGGGPRLGQAPAPGEPFAGRPVGGFPDVQPVTDMLEIGLPAGPDGWPVRAVVLCQAGTRARGFVARCEVGPRPAPGARCPATFLAIFDEAVDACHLQRLARHMVSIRHRHAATVLTFDGAGLRSAATLPGGSLDHPAVWAAAGPGRWLVPGPQGLHVHPAGLAGPVPRPAALPGASPVVLPAGGPLLPGRPGQLLASRLEPDGQQAAWTVVHLAPGGAKRTLARLPAAWLAGDRAHFLPVPLPPGAGLAMVTERGAVLAPVHCQPGDRDRDRCQPAAPTILEAPAGVTLSPGRARVVSAAGRTFLLAPDAHSGAVLRLDMPAAGAPGWTAGPASLPCDAGCATCSGPGAQECTSCPGELVLQAGACVAECPAGAFVCEGPAVGAGGGGGGGRQCQACPAGCSACRMAAPGPGGAACLAECTACAGGQVLHEAGCVDACPVGFFPRAGAPVAACAPCHKTCAVGCTGPEARDCDHQPPSYADGLAIGLGVVFLTATVLLLGLIAYITMRYIQRRRAAQNKEARSEDRGNMLHSLTSTSTSISV